MLLRNHEIDPDLPGVERRGLGPREAYDRAAPAGVARSRYDLAAGPLRESRPVLNGTLENCNGSPTLWGTWLSCEDLAVV
ncbi:PhoX family protein [Frankia gtarii]|uniref:PhoX family protein n=1 Tax=Frankia gtarii TaxID=2950102 RepID=UPI0021BE9EC2|nr:PhoX family protein [Frankia gtarii]